MAWDRHTQVVVFNHLIWFQTNRNVGFTDHHFFNLRLFKTFNQILYLLYIWYEQIHQSVHFNITPVCACPKPWVKFPTFYVVVDFVVNELRSGVIVSFLDIGEIVDHHCLNFLIITWSEKTKTYQQRYYDISEPWHIGHHSFSENDTSEYIVDIFSLILIK
jgi:hypothetical protein